MRLPFRRRAAPAAGGSPGGLAPEQLLEAQAQGVLAGFLHQLADLAEHSVAVLEDVAAQNVAAAQRSSSLQQRAEAVAARLVDVEGAVQSPAHAEAYLSAALAVPGLEPHASAAHEAARLHEQHAPPLTTPEKQLPELPALLPEELTPLRFRFSPAQSPVPERPSPLPAAARRLALGDPSAPAAAAAEPPPPAQRPPPLRKPSGGGLSQDLAKALAHEARACVEARRSRDTLPESRIEAACPEPAGAAHAPLEAVALKAAAVQAVPAASAPCAPLEVLAMEPVAREPAEAAAGEPACMKAPIQPVAYEQQPAPAWPASPDRGFLKGLEHLLPSAPAIPAGLEAEVIAAVPAPVEPALAAEAVVADAGPALAGSKSAEAAPEAVAVTCNPLYMASADAGSSLPPDGLRRFSAVGEEPCSARSGQSEVAVSVSARSSESQSPVARRKSAELDAFIAAEHESSVHDSAAAPADPAAAREAAAAEAAGLQRSETLEGQVLPFGQTAVDFGTLNLRCVPSTALADQDTDFAPLGAAAGAMQAWQLPPLQPAVATAAATPAASPLPTARTVDTALTAASEASELGSLALSSSYGQFQGSVAGGGPTFMRTTRPGSPILPAELLLREGPLSGGGARLAAGGGPHAAEAVRQRAWGESRYVLPGGGSPGGGWRFHDQPPRSFRTEHALPAPPVWPGAAQPSPRQRQDSHEWLAAGLAPRPQPPAQRAPSQRQKEAAGGGWGGAARGSPTKPPPLSLDVHAPAGASPTLPPPLSLENSSAAANRGWDGGRHQQQQQQQERGWQPQHAGSGLSRGALRASWGEESQALSAFGADGMSTRSTQARAGWGGRGPMAGSSVATSPATSPVQAPSPSGGYRRRFGLAPMKASGF